MCWGEKTVSGALAPLAESEMVELNEIEHARPALKAEAPPHPRG
jgi:hypothetical protein